MYNIILIYIIQTICGLEDTMDKNSYVFFRDFDLWILQSCFVVQIYESSIFKGAKLRSVKMLVGEQEMVREFFQNHSRRFRDMS